MLWKAKYLWDQAGISSDIAAQILAKKNGEFLEKRNPLYSGADDNEIICITGRGGDWANLKGIVSTTRG